ncbi:MAG: ATP-binding protein [Thermodesulfobacteriota bacterium]
MAVSGGKDSLSLWHILAEMGYQVDGFHLDLGLGDYSRRSWEKVESFAGRAGLRLIITEAGQETGLNVAELAAKRKTCSVCGQIKRYIFNRTAWQRGYLALATGHNLDDEAARLLGNTLKCKTDFLARQRPVLPAHRERLVRRVKPLFRLTEKEVAAYAFLLGIDYLAEECPHASGATSLVYKRAINLLEEASPGSASQLYLGFIQRAGSLFEDEAKALLSSCQQCGQLTPAEVCSYCRLIGRAS